jgi:hypothetical protein
MASRKVLEIVDQLLIAIKEEAAAEIQSRLGQLMGISSVDLTLMPKRKSTKGQRLLKPCPVVGCQETAAPRFQMVCKHHGKTLTREEILVARDKASSEGGVWYNLALLKK